MVTTAQVTPSPLATLATLTAAQPAPRISEVVLQTARFAAMRAWYSAVLGLPWHLDNAREPATERARYADSPKQVRASDVRSCFMFLDRSQAHGQVLALFELPELAEGPSRDPGLNHLQFRHAGVPALIERVELLLAHGIEPHRASNHGPITSFYFTDPDLNVVELCSNNFDSAEKMQAFIASDAFRNNPSGIELDARAFIGRFRAGEPLERLLAID